MTNVIVGIDLGTTNSLIGVVDAGFPGLIASAGERLTPSAVYFPETGEPLVGRPALRMRALDPARTVTSIKRAMGTAARFAGRRPEEISALILQKLKRDAEAALGHEVTGAVITVPAYFNDAQRQATKTAGELAGFTVERILSEPTAAALAYGLEQLGERSRIAVYDLGGGTFDISILQLTEKVFEVLATSGHTHLGGDDIDDALWQTFPSHHDPRLRDAVIAAKHRLSTEIEARIELPFTDAEQSFSRVLTRAQLDEISRPIIERTRVHCRRALADANLAASDLDAVVLVGGATRMPLVREFVRALFGREADLSQNPDEAVALGATIQAGRLSGAMQSVLLLDITPLSLGIETFGGLMNVIIPRNSTIPIKAGEMFTNAVANQASMKINVLQGEREMARDNWSLGSFELPFSPAPKGRARVGVQFEIDADGLLHVLARDTPTGHEQIIKLQSAVDVSDEAVEKMIGESIEHAWDDLAERVWTEAKLKSEEMLPAVRRALQLVGAQLTDAERAEIQTLLAAVETALQTTAPEPLKKANAALDAGTQKLATLLLEAATAPAAPAAP